MNVNSVFRLLAYILLFVMLLMGVPTAMAYAHGETSSLVAFLETLGIMGLFSILVLIITGRKKEEMQIGAKESYLFVSLVWVLITIFGALPLYLTHTLPTYAGCFFEIMSGFTTTGATAMLDVEANDLSILFWRNMTNWLGGMGIVVLFVAVLPAFGVKGTALVGAESVGPTKDKLTPQIQRTAMALWLIYFALSVIETGLLMLGGLDLFNAVTVTFGTMGAAGFTTTNLSIASYNSAYIEWVCIIFMFLAGANFALYFKLIKGQVKKTLRDGELRLYFTIVMVASLCVAVNLMASSVYNAADSIRHSFFQIISFITTTGFSSTAYQNWPIFSQIVLLALCFVGGCAGSAGGGIKVIRILVIMKLGGDSIRKRLHPNAVTTMKAGDDSISQSTILSICGFIGLYLLTLAAGTVLISLSGENILTCFSSCILTLGNIGIGLGGIGMDFSFSIYADWALWIFSFLMLVGRLELFTVYALFTRDFWKN